MPVDVSVHGVEQLERVGRDLKEVGRDDLRKQLYAGLNRATKPLKAAVKQSALDRLPRTGGLNKVIASSRLTTSSRMSGANPGVRIVGRKSGHDLDAIDRGQLRHPVFGNRSVWVTQNIDVGWFTKPIEDGVGIVRREILSVLDDIAEELSRGR